MTKNRSFLSMICCCTERGSLSQVSVLPIRAVEQERRPRRRDPQNVLPFEQGELVAGDEAGGGDQIGRADRLGAEAQMGNRLGAGLVGIVDEIALRIQPGVFGDDLDAVLVGADRAVGAQAVEDRAGRFRRLDGEIGIDGEAVCETSSSMPRVKLLRPANWFLSSRRVSSSNAALAMAGVKSFEERP